MDYIIVGAGPTGMTIAYLLGKAGKKCILIDQNDSIGGCHRVKRVNGMFTEHSPRVYLSSYVNTKKLLTQMNSSFHDLFTPYHFSIIYITTQLLFHLTFWEILIFVNEFMIFLNYPYDQRMSVQTFTEKNGFSVSSIDYLDRMCRFSDGAGMERYSMYQLLQLINQQLFYGLYQPKLPNDIGLLPIMQKAIEDTGVHILFNQTVSSILYQNGLVTGVKTSNEMIYGHNIVLAVPPPALFKLLQSPDHSPFIMNAFGNIKHWTQQSSYNIDIAATFHWDTVIPLPIKWGFPSSEWGLISIPLTDYMDMNDARSKTVISTCITYLDSPSLVLNKTANQIQDKEQLVAEMFRQLKQTYPELPNPTTSILSPTVYYTDHWEEQDSGFFKSTTAPYLSEKSRIPNLFQVGPQNGQSTSSFTTFEAAVSNGISFVNHQIPTKIILSSPIELKKVFHWIFIGIFLLLLFLIYIKFKRRFT